MANYITTSGNVSGLQLISTTTSIPPLSVANSNLVSNLNVQYFNNNLSSFYTNAANINDGLLKVSYGGTGVSSFTTGYLHFGSSNGILGQSSNLYWNIASNYLGIGTLSPRSPLYVASISGSDPDTTGISVYSSNSNLSPVVSLRQYVASNISNPSLGYISFDAYFVGGFSIGMNPNTTVVSNSNQNNTTLDIRNAWNFGGIPMMSFNSNTGFVGLRTQSPASLMDINAGSNTSLILRGQNTQQYIYPVSNNNKSEIGFCSTTSNTSNMWLIGQATGSNVVSNSFALTYSSISNNVITVLSNGYVGIGTCNPSSNLDVVGSINASSSFTTPNQFISTIATGTSPFQVSSTTVVNNLNASLLGGSNLVNVLALSNHTGTLSTTKGGTGLTSIAQGYIPFGQGISNNLGTSSTLFWNSSSNYLGINTSNPVGYLDVVTPTSNAINAFIRGGQYRQLIVCPGSTISNTSNQACEIILNQVADYTNLSNIGTIGINSQNCGISNLGLCSPGKGLAMTIQSNTGYVGVGTSNPIVPFDVEATITNSYTNYTYFNNQGQGGKAAGPYSAATSIYGLGRIVTGGEFEIVSDLRLKQNILPLDTSQQIDFIKLLKPVKFQWKNPNNSKKQIGFIAQDILSTDINFEEIVNMHPNPSISTHTDSNGFVSPEKVQFSLSYDAFSPVIVSVVQHMLKQIDDLQSQVSQLQQRVDVLSTP